MFAKYGMHIYDVHKNMFDNGSYNTIQFKVRQNKDEEKMKEKMDEIEKNLSKNYKMKINKEEKKDLKINNKMFVNEPGKKVGVYNENIGQNEEKKYFKINNIKRKQSFRDNFSKLIINIKIN